MHLILRQTVQYWVINDKMYKFLKLDNIFNMLSLNTTRFCLNFYIIQLALLMRL